MNNNFEIYLRMATLEGNLFSVHWKFLIENIAMAILVYVGLRLWYKKAFKGVKGVRILCYSLIAICLVGGVLRTFVYDHMLDYEHKFEYINKNSGELHVKEYLFATKNLDERTVLLLGDLSIDEKTLKVSSSNIGDITKAIRKIHSDNLTGADLIEYHPNERMFKIYTPDNREGTDVYI